jgi:RNA polymerase sigma-70 factor, ECF subfamily
VRAVRAVAAFTGNVDFAQDAVDEALARLLTNFRRGRDVSSIPAWVTTVALNYAKSRWRKRRFDLFDTYEHAPRSTEDERDDAMAVRAALQQLPLRQRQAAVLFYLNDISIDEIAIALLMQPGTVKSHLSRARTALAATLGPQLLETRGEP